MHGASRLDAERAGVELVERERGGFLVDGSLALRRAPLRARTGKRVAKNNHLAQADTQSFNKHGYRLETQRGAVSLPAAAFPRWEWGRPDGIFQPESPHGLVLGDKTPSGTQ
ncbi:hypothetical protein D3C85_1569200 [compost metagenome]